MSSARFKMLLGQAWLDGLGCAVVFSLLAFTSGRSGDEVSHTAFFFSVWGICGLASAAGRCVLWTLGFRGRRGIRFSAAKREVSA
ncbi:MAG: hypothetical protein AAGI53_02140 [Planctomycetota bacterium]